MTYIISKERFRQGVFLLFVALAHLLIFCLLVGRTSHRPLGPDPIQWIVARQVVERLRANPVPAFTAASRRPTRPSRPSETLVVSTAIGFVAPTAPAAPPAPAPSAPAQPLDLSPERLGSLLDRARRSDPPRMPLQSWRAAVDEKSGPVRQTETVGASGSRVTRVEGPFGTYCIRSPQPGRASAPGAGPEMALPTSCS